MFPATRLAPLTVSDAVALAPEVVRVAVPREALPAVNVTVPDGTLLPEAAFTVTVRTVVALCAMLAGFAVTVIVVAVGTVTLTATGAEADELKPVAPA